LGNYDIIDIAKLSNAVMTSIR